MGVCSIEGCAKPSRKRGWCEMHYSRFKAHGTPHGPGRRAQPEVCQVDDCEKRPVAQDMCKQHYYAAKRAAERASRPPPPPPPVCSIEGCVDLAISRGWCGAHYQRWRRFGDPEFVPPPAKNVCRVEGCTSVTNAQGLCGPHYYRMRRYGDPLVGKNRPRETVVVTYPARVCVTCGRLFEPGTSAVRKYCSRTCKPSRASGGINNRATVVRLATAHGWYCRLCGDPIEPGLYWPNVQAGSVDHVIPVLHGGSDDWENLQLAHLRCNLKKGAAVQR